MSEFIAKRIIVESKKSIADAKSKYCSYFVTIKKKIYEEFRSDVDEILRKEGLEEVIVTE